MLVHFTYHKHCIDGAQRGIRVIPTTCQQQNPQFFKPNMRLEMKKRQEVRRNLGVCLMHPLHCMHGDELHDISMSLLQAAMLRRREEKQQEWSEWEKKMDEEELMRREQASQV